MKILVVTSEPITADRLREAFGSEQAENAEVMVVAPALHRSALRFWLSDADEAIQRAEAVEKETVRELETEGVTAHGDTGEGDVVEAIGDALTTFPADRILLFTHSNGKRYKEDISAEDLRERFPVPVEQKPI